jgi:hypothetical protein
MSKSNLNISDDLSLPVELAARTQCIFAQKGAGKTYAAGVMTEEMLAAGVQVCVLDPTGVWWGLQSTAAGGKSDHEIIVMGGGHADVPLEPDAGEIVATFLVETGQSVVLDVSQFESQAAQDRFALALATKLYRLKAHDKANIHVFLDEADQFCPMKPQKGQERLLHAWDLIVRLGRSRGLGLTAISQRPAVVHTNIRNNVDLLTCLRVTGPHDFKALKEWTGIHATADQAREFLESVPTLADGEAFFWSPAWLRIFRRAKVRRKQTFDSSRTPKPGEAAVVPKARRAPDLTKLTEQIRASVERAKANDPAEMRKTIADLRKQLAAKPAPPLAEPKVVERPVVSEKLVKDVDSIVSRLEREGERRVKAGEDLAATGRDLQQRAAEFVAALRSASVPQRAVPIPSRPAASPPARVTRPPSSAVGDASVGGGGLRRILIALAQRDGLTNRQIGVRAGLSSGSGSFGTYMSKARSNGWISDDGDRRRITEAGRAALGDYAPLPEGPALLAYWLDELGESGAARILRALAEAYPDAMTNEQIGAAASLSHGSGSFGTYMSRLRTLELIVTAGRGMTKASDELFDGSGVSR